MDTMKASEILCRTDRNTPESKIKARADSIRAVGLIHTVKIQPTEDDNYRAVVVAGRCSFLALTQVIGLEELVVGEHVSYIEGDPDLIAFIENDERTGLTLAEQMEKLQKLSEKCSGVGELAAQTGYSPKWIAARLRLQELSDSWKQAMKDNAFPRFGIGHFEVIAKFPEDVQEQIFSDNRWNRDFAGLPATKLGKQLETQYTHLLRNAPWNTDGSYQGCGTCPACLERQNGGFLFDDMNDYSQARCQNRAFYQERLNEHLANLAAEIAESKAETLLVAETQPLPEGLPFTQEEVWQPYAWQVCPKKKGGQRALVVCGPKAGRFIYAKLHDWCVERREQQETREGRDKRKGPKTLAERKRLKNRQRQRQAIDALIEYVTANQYPVPDRDTILCLIACLGVEPALRHGSPVAEAVGVAANGTSNRSIAAELEQLDKLVWNELISPILRDLKLGQNGPVHARWQEAEEISQITGFDLEAAFEEATKALPDPKCWAVMKDADSQPDGEQAETEGKDKAA